MTSAARLPDDATPSKPSITKIFVERLTRENRLPEWQAALATVQATGKKYGQARWIAMKNCGYQGPDHERQLHERWLASQTEKVAAEIEQKVEERVGVIQSQCSFEDALKQLPLSCDSTIENEWVLAHPAMSRKTRATNTTDPVLITAADLLQANHGPCPSAAAANKLVHWANNPSKVYENLAIVMKKTEALDSSKNPDYIDDPGIQEIQQLLAAVRSGLPTDEDEIEDAIELLGRAGYVVAKAGEPQATSPTA